MAEKFRLRMARQLGEKTAKEFGFDNFPILPRDIAARAGIAIEAKPPEVRGVNGGILILNNQAVIFHSTDIENQGFINFTLAHELGHYFLPGHPEAIVASGGIHASRSGFSQGTDSIEIEADHFAAGLLMPTALVQATIRSSLPGLDAILDLREAAQSSLTAAAIRVAECTQDAVGIVVSQGTEVAYAFLSDSLKDFNPTYLRKGKPLPQTATRAFNSDPSKVRLSERACERTTFSDWFGGPQDFPIDEEIIGLGRYGYTLTVLSTEESPSLPDDDDNDDVELLEKWTPRFAYNR